MNQLAIAGGFEWFPVVLARPVPRGELALRDLPPQRVVVYRTLPDMQRPSPAAEPPCAIEEDPERWDGLA